jgi:hypothetical protein
MSIAPRATGSARYLDPDDIPEVEPLVPRLQEYRVTPISRRAERRARIVRTCLYALCFSAGVVAGLGTARALKPSAPLAEQPVVTIRTVR